MTAASPAQHGIWFTEEAGLAGSAFHMAVEIWFDGDLDLDALHNACTAVAERHPALRSAFTDEAGSLQVVPGVMPPVLVTTLTESLVAQELASPFDLRHGPLARFTVASASPSRHLLLVTAHHIVFDGISKAVLVADLAAAYGGAQLAPLAPAPLPAVDLDAARDFWRDRFTGPGPVSLPGLRHVPAEAATAAHVTWSLGPVLSRGFGEAAGAAGVTRFEFLLTGLLTLLHRYADQPPTVAVDVSTRSPETADHIGHFVNELPITVTAPADGTFAAYATDVRAALREAYRHRAAPVARVVGGLRPAPALTPVSMSYRHHGGGEAKFAGLDATVTWMVPVTAARNALHLQVLDETTDLHVSLQFSPAAIDADAVSRIAGHLGELLTAAITAPAAPLATLPVLTGAERELLRAVNDTAVAYPSGTVDDLIAAVVASTPDAVAIVDSGRELTYAQLDTEVAAVAGALAARGAGPGALIGVCLPRSVPMVVTMLAVLRCGAAYLPLDVSHPQPRRAMILDDARPLLTVDEQVWASLDRGEGQAPRAGELAYVMYTSGSTGRPKGVEVTVANLRNLLLGLRDALGSGPADTWLALTSPAFDISALELLLPLITGGRLVLAPPELARDAVALHRLIADHGVTHVQATPSGWQLLLEGGRLPGLRVALAGGEALPAALASVLRGEADRLVNVYGPTETTIWSTMDDVGDGDVTVGRPIANTQAYVLDASMRPVPLEVTGELWLGGAGVARGYLGRPELDRERFLPDPFGPAGARLYRTGDLARWRTDGRLDFLGRLDGQVKIRGHRVELGEIEARLTEHPEISQAAVALRGEPPRLVAYLVAAAVPADLRARLEAALPSAMVPSAFVQLDRLPLTPNGKLDRAALPEPPAVVPSAPVEDAGPIAAELLTIWSEVLEIDGIGLDEEIFDLGGHSLLIVKIISRIRRQLGVDVPIEVFLDTPTVRGLAEAITDYHRSNA
ncbi:amino acid adenylation domain-containing protein [Allocatelliglobosispora scoriae]|uniref:Amino acid adenylation domain-containing protein n=1 Tax=Allocatelliglobosispora scoriae TaxID=643052 RepID=A0A841BNM7_9ACTN|nr:amino acid adenylation domain-containing protein [Allocatelliglobosispora scoriae]MBB5868896.1 amino acid adenylation domain-containing protein [Allocatelliglobosispora scoriae]